MKNHSVRIGIAVYFLLATLSSCATQEDVSATARSLAGGSIASGERWIRNYGCPSCHTISGVRGADGLVGPPLDGIASRTYIAGVLQNTPNNLVRWIQDPPGVDPLTAMPNLGISEAEARDIASYLYTLR